MCEGEKTERNYFEGLIKYLNLDIKVKYSKGGKNTTSLVKEYNHLYRDEKCDFGRVLFIFDKDSFDANNFNVAAEIAERIGTVAWSNESFELWLCLHFYCIVTAQTRHWYNNKLTSILREKGFLTENQSYEDDGKSDPNIFSNISEAGGCYKKAIERAKKLTEDKALHNPAKANPCTLIYKAVEALIEKAKKK
ncbi:MAG: RloB family protein [Defluviitaleaceae bacterium]|nr:RloB family protein [Defluviitaleaceae bacterium]